ncbi:uncharacterized protein TRUGW13939_01543 [Talaromyces rugulosus]|uniref:Uncharacterized protein n=1 Tax=Talaromyces rugulosus TaxID=121627 RepID=A0A7H8QKH8_TALRU|nr:uncharacterized protein TRUGW13939_01543 [Talaromyces rugulosus]QKX54457.1 hypothetical protein TRUGW13939_01543 [Talaromyces rugulosus]
MITIITSHSGKEGARYVPSFSGRRAFFAFGLRDASTAHAAAQSLHHWDSNTPGSDKHNTSFENSCILDASRRTLAGEVSYYTGDDEPTSPVAARVLGNEIPDSQDEGSESAGAKYPVMSGEPLNPQDGIEDHDDDDYGFNQSKSDDADSD